MPLKDWLLESSEEEGMMKEEHANQEEQARQKYVRLLEARYEEEWKELRYMEGKV
jgi:hypothetical protein